MQRTTISSTGLASAAVVQRSDRLVEDCRDYLRTGRCKYGASCKYNHPPNVQSGGGMKTPIDPTEPLFPIRPNEPLCQYYMKHGTCKFGQACKFHHPPHATAGAGTGVMNRRTETPRMILNPVATDGSAMMLQFLPQRPEEPDCIYFLKNGRCKYGTTCRYHHPINGSFQNRRQEEVRRTTPMHDQFSNKIQFVNQGQLAQGIVSDGPVAFVNLDGSPALAPVTFIQNSDGTGYCAPLANTVATEQGSSASSIGSSHDTSGSTLEYIAVPGDGPNPIWQRVRKNGSGGSLNAYVVDQGRLVRARLPTSSSDGNIARRNRSTSYGSSSDNPGYYETGPSQEAPVWRQSRSSSFDQTRRPHEPATSSPAIRGRPSSSRLAGQRMPQRPGQGHGDEGFTMMTSALLNMLDTPEETSAEVYSEDGTYHYAIDDDDATKLMGGLSLHRENASPSVLASRGPEFDDSSWSPSWQQSDNLTSQRQDVLHPYMRSGHDILHPYMQSQLSAPSATLRFHHSHSLPDSDDPSDFGQYLP